MLDSIVELQLASIMMSFHKAMSTALRTKQNKKMERKSIRIYFATLRSSNFNSFFSCFSFYKMCRRENNNENGLLNGIVNLQALFAGVVITYLLTI